MSEKEPTDATPPAAEQGPNRSLFWLVPTLTFLVGLGLGALLISLTSDGDGEAAVSPGTSQTPTVTTGGEETPSGGATIVVPQECITAAQQAEQATALIERGVQAARDLDAAQLQEIVDDLQTLRPQIEESAQACRGAATAPSQ